MATFTNPKPLFTSAVSVAGQISLTFVSTGIGMGPITPSILGRVALVLAGEFSSSLAGNGGAIAIYRNVTGVPAVGVAVGIDVAVWTGSNMLSSAIGQVQADSGNIFDTSGTAGAFYYVAIKAVTGGTVTAGNVSIVAEEK